MVHADLKKLRLIASKNPGDMFINRLFRGRMNHVFEVKYRNGGFYTRTFCGQEGIEASDLIDLWRPGCKMCLKKGKEENI